MAKIFLDGTESYLVANNGSEVFGGTGANVITVAAGVTGVIFDQQVERIALNYATTDLAFKQSGNRIEVYTGGQMVMRAIVQQDTDGTLLTTTSGTMQVKVDANGMTVGGTLVTATTTGSTATALTPATVDTTITTGGTAGAASYSVAAGADINDEGSPATFTVTRTGDITAAKTLSYQLASDATPTGVGATPGTDTTVISGTVTFAAGARTTTFSITPTSDQRLEGLEGLKVTILDGIRSVASTQILINDDQRPAYTLTVNSPSVTEGNSGTSNLNFTLTLDRPATSDVVVAFETTASGTATVGTDFTGRSGTVTIASGQSTQSVAIAVVGDSSGESDETVAIAFSGASLVGPVAAAGTITNDDGLSVSLTTNVDSFSGTVYPDIYAATTTNTGATLNSGDAINGGGGSDRLNLLSQGGGVAVALDSVEVIDIRMLSATSFDATTWSGVEQVIVNNQSSDDLTLTITNGNQNTRFIIADDANAVVDYLDDSGTGDTALLGVDNGGVTGSAATFTISATEAVNLNVSGTSFVSITAGDTALRDIAISGQGTLTFDIAETSLSGLSLAGFSGTSTITVSAASNVRFTGGTGNDSIAFGTTFNGQDTVDGGGGNDTITATLGGIAGFSRVSNVETGSFDTTSTVVADASGASFTTINISAIETAGDITVNNLGTVTLNLRDTGSASDLVLDYVAGANATVNLTSVAGAAYSSMTITDASGVAITNAASGAQSFDQFSGDADVKSLALTTSSGASTFSAMVAPGLGTLTIAVGQSGSFRNTGITASALTSVSLLASGTSAVGVIGALSLNTGNVTIGVSGVGGNVSAQIGNLTFAASGSTTVRLAVEGSGAVGVGGAVTQEGSGTLSLGANAQGASAAVRLGTVTLNGSSGVSTISLGASGAQASAAVGVITFNTASTNVLSVSLGGDASASIGNIQGASAIAGTLTISVLAGASSDVSFGTIGFGSADQGSTTAGTVVFNYSLGSGDLSVGALSVQTLAISGMGGNNASATFNNVVSAQSVGSITLAGSGSLDINEIRASASVGAISITDGVFSASVVAPSIGAITVAGDGFVLAGSAVGGSFGAITVGDSHSGSATITNVGTASFGAISLGGGGVVRIDVDKASAVGPISTQGRSGQFTLEAGSSDARIIASLGAATGDIEVSRAGSAAGLYNGDLYSLAASTGVNYFRFQASSNNDITIQNFEVGANDRFYFSTAGFNIGGSASEFLGSAHAGADAATALGVLFVTSNSAGDAILTSAQGVIVLGTGTYADASAAVAFLSTAVSAGYRMDSAAEFIVVWADTNGGVHLSLADIQASSDSGGRLASSMQGTHLLDLALLSDNSLGKFSGTTQFYSY